MVNRNYANGFTVLEMERAMFELLDGGRIVANEPVGQSKSRHPRYGLVRTVQPEGTA